MYLIQNFFGSLISVFFFFFVGVWDLDGFSVCSS